MSYSLRFAPELEEDLYSGFVWYEDKAKGLGDEFLTVFYSNVDQLTKTPLIYAKVYLDFHRSLLRQFPFACYYRIEGDMVVVYGLFHSARNPAYITSTQSFRATRHRSQFLTGCPRRKHSTRQSQTCSSVDRNSS